MKEAAKGVGKMAKNAAVGALYRGCAGIQRKEHTMDGIAIHLLLTRMPLLTLSSAGAKDTAELLYDAKKKQMTGEGAGQGVKENLTEHTR